MFLQAPVIGVMLRSCSAPKKPVPYWCLGALQELAREEQQSATRDDQPAELDAADHRPHRAMFFVVVSCVWFGTSNAAREIVTERAIYLRERMVNLRLFNYVLSQVRPARFICVLQCVMLLGIVFLGARLQRRAGWLRARTRQLVASR